MNYIDSECEYYAFTFIAGENDAIVFSTQTHWVGWADSEYRRELRVPSLVNPYQVIKHWDRLKQPYLVVSTDEQYFVYGLLGGNALVEVRVAERNDSRLLEAKIVARSGELGFVSIDRLPRHALNRAPTPKNRMRIIKRDGYRCRICGRRPADYEDVELHVHHIRPWSRGGLTEDVNLITLCHTCHKGLDPHEDHFLFRLLRSSEPLETGASMFLENVFRYRELIWDAYQDVA